MNVMCTWFVVKKQLEHILEHFRRSSPICMSSSEIISPRKSP